VSIFENLSNVKNIISRYELDSGRKSGSVTLLAVSKTKPVELMIEAYECGQRLFGENKVQEAEEKKKLLPEDVELHLIGHLQSNKVKKACNIFSCIHSVDSLKIAKKIDSICFDLGKIMNIFVEVNIAEEESKTGYIPNSLFFDEFEQILKLENLNVLGLMCIGANSEDSLIIRTSFNRLKVLQDELKHKFTNFHGDSLSMGMSNDLPEAISEGSTIVRVGSSIFGSRI